MARGATVSFRCGHNGRGLEYKTVPPFIFRRPLPCAERFLPLGAARFDARAALGGAIVLLKQQDHCAWNWSDVREGMTWIEQHAAPGGGCLATFPA